MATSVDDITEAMKDVIDPELGINVIDLGLVYDMRLDENNIATLDMTLTQLRAHCKMLLRIKPGKYWRI